MTRFAVLLASLVLTTQALAPPSAFSTTPRPAAVAPDSAAESRAAFSAEKRVALEDEFFELMWLCDSPVESERDAAQEELTRRFDEFEPVWKDRTFLTDGEVADESRRRFERAEKDFWTARLERARNAFDVELTVAPTEGEGDASSGRSADATSRRASVRVSWRVPLRVVWLAPDLRTLLWRDPETNRLWRPRSLYSAPELQPEFGANQVEFDLFLEPVPNDALPSENDVSSPSADKTTMPKDASAPTPSADEAIAPKAASAPTLAEDATSLEDASDPTFADDATSLEDASEPTFADDASPPTLAFDALVGVDPVPISISLCEDEDKTREYRVGELTLRVSPVERDEKGGRTVALCLDYDRAFDAFDSHRTWREPDDLLLAIPDAADGVRPDAIRVRDRSPSGERLELSCAPDPALDEAFRQNAAALICRLPRFFIRLRDER